MSSCYKCGAELRSTSETIGLCSECMCKTIPYVEPQPDTCPADLQQMPLRDQFAEIACLNCDSKDECTGDGNCAIVQNLMNHLNAWLPARDQQVASKARAEFAEKAGKKIEAHKLAVPLDTRWERAAAEFQNYVIDTCLAHLTAMAEGGS